MARSKNVHFLVKCPRCGKLSTQRCSRTELLRDVQSGVAIGLQCIPCDREWEAGWHELEGIKRLLGQGPLAD